MFDDVRAATRPSAGDAGAVEAFAASATRSEMQEVVLGSHPVTAKVAAAKEPPTKRLKLDRTVEEPKCLTELIAWLKENPSEMLVRDRRDYEALGAKKRRLGTKVRPTPSQIQELVAHGRN